MCTLRLLLNLEHSYSLLCNQHCAFVYHKHYTCISVSLERSRRITSQHISQCFCDCIHSENNILETHQGQIAYLCRLILNACFVLTLSKLYTFRIQIALGAWNLLWLLRTVSRSFIQSSNYYLNKHFQIMETTMYLP